MHSEDTNLIYRVDLSIACQRNLNREQVSASLSPITFFASTISHWDHQSMERGSNLGLHVGSWLRIMEPNGGLHSRPGGQPRGS